MSWTHSVEAPQRTSKITGHFFDVDNTDFRRSDVSTKAPVQGLAIQTSGRMYIVDSGGSFHVLGISSLSPREKRRPRKSEHVLGIQATSGIYVLDVATRSTYSRLWVHLAEDSPSALSLGRLCNDSCSSHSGPSGGTPTLSQASKTSSLWLQ